VRTLCPLNEDRSRASDPPPLIPGTQ
jgi:hypothetical protein